MVVTTLSHEVSGNVFCAVATDLVGTTSMSIDGAFDAVTTVTLSSYYIDLMYIGDVRSPIARNQSV